MDARTLWAAYAAGDVDARDALLRENLSLVHHVARQLARGLAADADVDELVSAGTMGLMSALESFDVGRGLAFSTFAVPRIRGAILDELRRQDHVPRSVRRKTRSIAAAREALTRTLGRAPALSELAAALGVDAETLWRWQADVEGAVQVPLDRSTADHDGASVTPADVLGNGEELTDERLSREEEVALLREALLGLKDQERTVLSLYYFEELKAREIAEVLGVSESRISQIRSKALAQLRTMLAPLQVSA
ncbi:MAG: FliA/WhiG family RNA polymerase sigma factor [Gemmatimonadaceae bacterium]|nr:FliA/WhiG family RNA polymerase sigma factor [Gemmatimonadaceae bacterium]